MPIPLLLTRPEEDNRALAETLHPRPVIHSPVLNIVRQAYAPPQGRPDAILLTSRHAVYACADFKDVPLYTVGAHTAACAKAAGCGEIRHVAPDMAHLEPHLPEDTRIVYFSGAHIRDEDVVSRHKLQRIVVYEAQAASALTEEAQAALRGDDMLGVVFYSPRSAGIFHALLPRNATAPRIAYCLSGAIADTCAARGGWQHIAVAASPTQEAMLHLLQSQN